MGLPLEKHHAFDSAELDLSEESKYFPKKNKTKLNLLRHTLCMQPEHELVALAQSGDMRAFEQLVEQNSDKMYRAAFRILNSKEQAEDCVQEACIKMYQKIHGFKLQSKVSTWLYSVTVNVALDMLRKNAKHTHNVEYDFDQLSSSNSNTPEKSAWMNNLGDITVQAINLLNDDVKVAFILRHYEECSIEEITQILGINASTVKSRIFRGVGRLRLLLQAKVGDYETLD